MFSNRFFVLKYKYMGKKAFLFYITLFLIILAFTTTAGHFDYDLWASLRSQLDAGAGIQRRLPGGQEPGVVQGDERVGEEGGVQRVLGQVLLPDAEHEPPAADELHPGQHGEKGIRHISSLRE